MTSPVVIDDLASPNLTPLQLQILDHFENRPVDLGPEHLIADAVARIGLTDFGPWVPQWRDYYLSLDHRAHYGYLHTVLKALTFLRGPRQWVLKSPQHCEQLGPLINTFPDATVAFTHRDPVAVIQSAITMLAYGDRMRRKNIDLDWLFEYWTDRIERLLRRCVADRYLISADRSIDIGFHQLNGGEMSLLRTLYELNGTELSEAARAAMQRYLDDNPRGKHGSAQYDLQRHFGRSAAEIRSRFAFYFARFDVRPEL